MTSLPSTMLTMGLSCTVAHPVSKAKRMRRRASMLTRRYGDVNVMDSHANATGSVPGCQVWRDPDSLCRRVQVGARLCSDVRGACCYKHTRSCLERGAGGRAGYDECRCCRDRSEERRVGKECRSRW